MRERYNSSNISALRSGTEKKNLSNISRCSVGIRTMHVKNRSLEEGYGHTNPKDLYYF
jgi:hypothetical protein